MTSTAAKMTAPLTITSLSGSIGAQVEGVDLRRDIPPAVAQQIREALWLPRAAVLRAAVIAPVGGDAEARFVLWDELTALHRAPNDFAHDRKVVRVTAGRVVPTAPTLAL